MWANKTKEACRRRRSPKAGWLHNKTHKNDRTPDEGADTKWEEEETIVAPHAKRLYTVEGFVAGEGEPPRKGRERAEEVWAG